VLIMVDGLCVAPVGKPIRVQQNKNPGFDEIDMVQKQYIAELTASVVFLLYA
jgi:hypothetical protein